MQQDSIKQLFKTRDNAVKTRDIKLFLSTQLYGLPNATVEGYFSVDEMETTLLYSYDDIDKTIVLVKEAYFTGGKKTHHGFILYYLTNTVNGWKIVQAVY